MLQYKRYDTTLDDVTSVLDQHGVATIPNILTHDECVTLRNALFAELSHVTKGRFNIDDPATWRHYYDLMPLHSMLTQHWGLGQSQPVWDIRQHPKVGEVFSHIWQTPIEEMLVSFDGISIHMPPETTKRGWYTGNKWLHTDQSSHKKGKHCIQGLINLFPVNPGDATLTILEGSHAHHEEFFEASGIEAKDDWHVIKTPAEQEFFATNDCQQYCVEADEGSMVLWDSRTMHSGIEPQRGRPSPQFRMVVYVCMMPRRTALPKDVLKKQKAFQELRITNHWANKAKLFNKLPRTYGKELPEFERIRPPVLTSLGRKLAGF